MSGDDFKSNGLVDGASGDAKTSMGEGLVPRSKRRDPPDRRKSPLIRVLAADAWQKTRSSWKHHHRDRGVAEHPACARAVISLDVHPDCRARDLLDVLQNERL